MRDEVGPARMRIGQCTNRRRTQLAAQANVLPAICCCAKRSLPLWGPLLQISHRGVSLSPGGKAQQDVALRRLPRLSPRESRVRRQAWMDRRRKL
ncbi:hypothetical protein GUJ93_ZPchr0003g18005 [Zizania palustris]|uniref:Uncharacterized protein n=1 Tax=Zizania palustris TaxID=103762 RepID=A0A8J5V5N3_ZIZPA|nr:hypothetical protein GUJ93_ZPchr0003g18005 [Zizania palustris]